MKRMTLATKQSAFLSGAGSVLDLSGYSYGKIKTGNQTSDTKALRGDWNNISNDLKRSLKSVSTSRLIIKKCGKNG